MSDGETPFSFFLFFFLFFLEWIMGLLELCLHIIGVVELHLEFVVGCVKRPDERDMTKILIVSSRYGKGRVPQQSSTFSLVT